MSNIVVLVKHVVDTNALKTDMIYKQPLFKGAITKISDYDKNAIEEAVRLKERFQSKVFLLSVGPEEAARTTLREGLAMGADEAILVSTNYSYIFDPTIVIKALKYTIEKIVGDFDLVLGGEFSEDLYQGVVCAGLAAELNVPFISSATHIDMVEGRLLVERELEDCVEILEATPPVVVSVTREINQPRIPTTFQIMKVPLTKVKILSPENVGVPELKKTDGLSVMLTKLEIREMPKRKGIKIEGNTVDELAMKLYDVLIKEGVI